MKGREKLKKAEKKVWKLLRKLYNKGYLISLEQVEGGYRFAFWHNKLHAPEKKIKE
jgi:biotin operon repressor